MSFLRASLVASFAFASFSMLSGCAADLADGGPDEGEELVESSEEAVTGGRSNFGYHVVTRRDFRKCASPMCGGWFIKRVNQAATRCADGTLQADCYVSSIELKNVGLSPREEAELRGAVESGKALLHGATYKKTFNGQILGTLKANEGWLGMTGSPAEGTFYRAADNGIRCIKAPCPSTTVYGLNGADDYNVIRVGLEHTALPADAEALDRARQALATKEGVLIAGGVAMPKCLPGSDCGPFANATEFYLRVTRREGKGCGSWGQSFCNAGQYCSWKAEDICGAADAGGTCAYKPEICTEEYAPVCACDGKTYGNACNAAAAGASVSSAGACAATK